MSYISPEGIVIPAGGDNWNLTTDLRTQAASTRSVVSVADRAAGDTVATAMGTDGRAVSATNPLVIFNQLTNAFEVKSGGGWQYPDGGRLIGFVNQAAASVGLSGSSVVCNAVQVSLVAGRWYKATYRVNTICSVSASIAIVVQVNKDTVSTGITGTAVDDSMTIYSAPVANQGKSDMTEYFWKAGATETVWIKVLMARLTTTSLYDISLRKLAVYDLGMEF